ncbi:hypothetical protein TRVL_02851 [Trypanosoma vivax]|nr:hypothetical protein TRVL_02851 [Trypanosoma vivax]
MNTTILLQRQMEFHGMLRHLPHTPSQLKDTHKVMGALSKFFVDIRSIASQMKVRPETVFQCLMHIGLGDAVSFDKQRRDGAVPMHQAKVLTRAGAIELEPRLREALSDDVLSVLVELCKSTRTLMRIKIEDSSDFNMTEKAIQQALEYLDFISNASSDFPETMFKFYMVEDEASLLKMLGGQSSAAASDEPVGASYSGAEEGGAEFSPLPSESRLEGEVRRLAMLCSSASEAAGERLKALQVLDHWFTSLPVDIFHRSIRRMVSHLSGPLVVCAGEKRSAICRQACALIATLAGRIPSSLYNEGPLSVALSKWCSVLLRGVFVTVTAIAHATDTAIRSLVVGSAGHPLLLKGLVDGLSMGSHPELRRRCLGYIALCLVASQGETYGGVDSGKLAVQELTTVAMKYMDMGDTNCRKMARAVFIVLTRFAGVVMAVKDKKTELLISQESGELSAALSDVGAFEVALFGARGTLRQAPKFSTSSAVGPSKGNDETARPDLPVKRTRPIVKRQECGGGMAHLVSPSREKVMPDTVDIYQTHDTLIMAGTPKYSSGSSTASIVSVEEVNVNGASAPEPRTQPERVALPAISSESRGKTNEAITTKFAPSLQRKIESLSSRLV